MILFLAGIVNGGFIVESIPSFYIHSKDRYSSLYIVFFPLTLPRYIERTIADRVGARRSHFDYPESGKAT